MSTPEFRIFDSKSGIIEILVVTKSTVNTAVHNQQRVDVRVDRLTNRVS